MEPARDIGAGSSAIGHATVFTALCVSAQPNASSGPTAQSNVKRTQALPWARCAGRQSWSANICAFDGIAPFVEQVVGRNGHETTVTHLLLAMELKRAPGAASSLWDGNVVGRGSGPGIPSLGTRRACGAPAMLRELVIGKHSARERC